MTSFRAFFLSSTFLVFLVCWLLSEVAVVPCDALRIQQEIIKRHEKGVSSRCHHKPNSVHKKPAKGVHHISHNIKTKKPHKPKAGHLPENSNSSGCNKSAQTSNTPQPSATIATIDAQYTDYPPLSSTVPSTEITQPPTETIKPSTKTNNSYTEITTETAPSIPVSSQVQDASINSASKDTSLVEKVPGKSIELKSIGPWIAAGLISFFGMFLITVGVVLRRSSLKRVRQSQYDDFKEYNQDAMVLP